MMHLFKAEGIVQPGVMQFSPAGFPPIWDQACYQGMNDHFEQGENELKVKPKTFTTQLRATRVVDCTGKLELCKLIIFQIIARLKDGLFWDDPNPDA